MQLKTIPSLMDPILSSVNELLGQSKIAEAIEVLSSLYKEKHEDSFLLLQSIKTRLNEATKNEIAGLLTTEQIRVERANVINQIRRSIEFFENRNEDIISKPEKLDFFVNHLKNAKDEARKYIRIYNIVSVATTVLAILIFFIPLSALIPESPHEPTNNLLVIKKGFAVLLMSLPMYLQQLNKKSKERLLGLKDSYQVLENPNQFNMDLVNIIIDEVMVSLRKRIAV